MKSKFGGRSVVISIFLMSGLVFIPLAIANLVYYLPRYYFSKSTVEIQSRIPSLHAHDPAAVLPVVQSVIAKYGPAADYRPIRQTDLMELGIWERDPKQAADEANEAALALQAQGSYRVRIWETAEPALAPGRPRVLVYMAPGLALGLASFIAGLFVLLRGRTSGNSGDQPLAPPF